MRTGGPRERQDRCGSRSVLQALTSSPLKEVGVRCFWELVDSRMWVKQRWGGRWWKFEKEGKLRDGVIGVGAGAGRSVPQALASSPLNEVGVRCFWELIDARLES